MASPFDSLFDYQTVFPEQPPFLPGPIPPGAMMAPPAFDFLTNQPPFQTPPGAMMANPAFDFLARQIAAPPPPTSAPPPTSDVISAVPPPVGSEFRVDRLPDVTPEARDDILEMSRRTIAGLEGGPRGYQTVVPSIGPRGERREALGQYGIMDFNLAEWSRAALGRVVTRDEFLANPDLQDQIFRHRWSTMLAENGGDVRRTAAQWLGGPSGEANPTPDRFGTTATAYADRFMARFGQLGRATPGVEDAANANLVNAFRADGLTQANAFQQPGGVAPPPPFTGTATALVPGLGHINRTAPGPQPGTLSALLAPINDFLFGRAPVLAGRMGGGALDLIDVARGSVPLREYNRQQQEAAAAIYTRGQQLRVDNPNATPQQLAAMLLRDPTFGRNALLLGANAATVLNAAVQPPTGPPTFQALSAGQGLVRNEGGQLTDTGIRQPSAEMQFINELLAMPPPQREEALRMLAARRARQPSDREEAWARLQAQNPSFYTAEMRDLFISGVVRPEPIFNNFGQTVGHRWVNAITNQPFTPPTAGQPPPTTSGAAGATPGVTPPAPGVAPPNVIGEMGLNPGQVSPADQLNALINSGGLSAGIPGIPGMGAGPGGQPPPTTTTIPGQTPPTTTTTTTGTGPPPPNMAPRVIGRLGDRDVTDVPELSASGSSLVPNAAHMFVSVGPGGVIRGLRGRTIGNIPGFETSDQATLDRQSLLRGLRSAYATYRRGRQLAGEHAESMAEIPSDRSLLDNPHNALGMAIALRESLVRELQLAMHNINDPVLDASTRRAASDRVVDIRNVLIRLPTMEQLFEVRGQISRGEDIPETGIPTVGELTESARSAAGSLTGGPRARSALPGNVRELELNDLVRLSQRSNLSREDMALLVELMERRQGRVPGSR